MKGIKQRGIGIESCDYCRKWWLFNGNNVLNIATAAAATDGEVKVFCTFEGLNLIHKEVHKQLVSYTLRKMLT